MPRQATNRAAVIPVLAEAFRLHGYEGTSMTVLQDASGLGRGSLYNFFPGGKDEMAAAVLEDVQAWFRDRIFQPLHEATAAGGQHALRGIDDMIDAVDEYFRSGRRVCLPGAFALGQERDRFAVAVHTYFVDWAEALTGALGAAGVEPSRETALRMLAGIQGGIVLTRALDDPSAFGIVLDGVRALSGGVTRPK
jgi:AcrR family transcriptional regulator